MKHVKIYLVLFGLITLASVGLIAWAPQYSSNLFSEDNLIENLSAGFFLIASIIGVFLYFNSKRNRKALIGLSAVSLLGFLDELSFGERLFNLNMPYIYDEKIDGAHDFINLALEILIKLANSYFAYLLLFLSIGTIIIVIILFKNRFKIITFFKPFYREPPFILALFFLILVFTALVLDLGLIKNDILFMIEELFEMNASLALLFCGLSLQEEMPSN